MGETASAFLTPWANFYIMTGSAAASLTGLMFVVITLVMGKESTQQSRDGMSTFSTPTVVHFGSGLLVAGVLITPWRVSVHPAILLGLAGLAGVIYIARIFHRSRRLTAYEPDAEDWTWYTILPFLAYGAILAGAILLTLAPVNAMFAFAAGDVLLIFIGIHNAWDIVTFLAAGGPSGPPTT